MYLVCLYSNAPKVRGHGYLVVSVIVAAAVGRKLAPEHLLFLGRDVSTGGRLSCPLDSLVCLCCVLLVTP